MHFLIPLISRTKSREWDVVCKNIVRTVEALRGQSSDQWVATIACQTRPKGINFDGQVRFLRYQTAPRINCNDKTEKIRALIRHTAKRDHRDGYIFFLDADDIPHPNLVDYIVKDNNGHGYFLPQGYLVDLTERKAVGFGIYPNENVPFHTLNGSTNALRFDTRKHRGHVFPALLRGPHMFTHERVRPFGYDIQPVPFPAMLYVFNHGDNLEVHRGRGRFQTNALETATIEGREFNSLLSEFGCSASEPAPT